MASSTISRRDVIQRKTITGTTNASGLLSLGLNGSAYDVLSCHASYPNYIHSIAIPDFYTGNEWIAKVLNGADMTVVANTSVSIEVSFVQK